MGMGIIEKYLAGWKNGRPVPPAAEEPEIVEVAPTASSIAHALIARQEYEQSAPSRALAMAKSPKTREYLVRVIDDMFAEHIEKIKAGTIKNPEGSCNIIMGRTPSYFRDMQDALLLALDTNRGYETERVLCDLRTGQETEWTELVKSFGYRTAEDGYNDFAKAVAHILEIVYDYERGFAYDNECLEDAQGKWAHTFYFPMRLPDEMLESVKRQVEYNAPENWLRTKFERC